MSVIGELRQIRDRLFNKIKQIEEDEDGGLAERVKKFSETKRELEDRVEDLTRRVLQAGNNPQGHCRLVRKN